MGSDIWEKWAILQMYLAGDELNELLVRWLEWADLVDVAHHHLTHAAEHRAEAAVGAAAEVLLDEAEALKLRELALLVALSAAHPHLALPCKRCSRHAGVGSDHKCITT